MAKVSEKAELTVEQEKAFHPKGGKPRVRNSPRMEIAARLIAEAIASGKPIEKREAMIRAGYSPKTARAQNSVIGKPSFQECLERYLPIDRIVKRHDELMDSQEDNVALRATELGYRVRGLIVSKSAHLHGNIGEVAVSWSDS